MYLHKGSQFNPATDEDGLFLDCIYTCLKLKAEASGYPDWVRSPEDEERYVETFWEIEGNRLDKKSIRGNAARRGLVKLCLNSVWGKLTVRNDRTQNKIIWEPKEIYRFFATPGIEVSNFVFATEDVV